MTDMPETPGDRLKQARINAGYPRVTDAAKALDMNLTTLSQHEGGQNGISRKRAEFYATAFNVSAKWILFGDERIDIEGLSPQTRTALETIITALGDASAKGVVLNDDQRGALLRAMGHYIKTYHEDRPEDCALLEEIAPQIKGA